MNTIILQLYKESQNYKNREDSNYWIYSIDSKIIKNDNGVKRYLTIKFYNRSMDENNNLMRLYLKINGEEIKVDDFVISKQFTDKNIMGVAIERDIEDESKDAEIISYIVDGKKVDLKGKYVTSIKLNEDEKKLNAIKKVFNNNAIVVPHIENDYWVCSCGYYNQGLNNICHHCGISKLDNENMENYKVIHMLPEIISNINVTLDETVEETVEKYVNAINLKYGIEKIDIIKMIDYEKLKNNQNILKSNEIKDFINTNEIKFDCQYSFNENITNYCNKFNKKIVTNEDVKSYLDLESLEYQFNTLCKEKKLKQKKFKRYILIGVLILALIVVGISAKTIYENYFVSFDDIEILNTLENREKVFEKDSSTQNFLKKCTYDDVKTVINDNKLCVNDLYCKEPPELNFLFKDNKKGRSLGNGYFLVEETNKKENKGTIEYYLADNKFNKIDSPLNSSKIDVEYDENERITSMSIDHDVIWNIEYEDDNVIYTNDEDTITMEYSPSTNEYVLNINDEKYVEQEKDNETIKITTRELNLFDDDEITNTDTISYNNNVMESKNNKEDNYYYDNNGLCTYYEVSDYFKEYYFYDFENGKKYICTYIGNELRFIAECDLMSFDKYLSNYEYLFSQYDYLADENFNVLNTTRLIGETKKFYTEDSYSNYEINNNLYVQYDGVSGDEKDRYYKINNTSIREKDVYQGFHNNYSVEIVNVDEEGISFVIKYNDSYNDINEETNVIKLICINNDTEQYTFNWEDSYGNIGTGTIRFYLRQLDDRIASYNVVDISLVLTEQSDIDSGHFGDLGFSKFINYNYN